MPDIVKLACCRCEVPEYKMSATALPFWGTSAFFIRVQTKETQGEGEETL